MKKILSIAILLLPIYCHAVMENSCVEIGRSVFFGMRNIMTGHLNIPTDAIIDSKTKLELLENVPLDKNLAEDYAKADRKELDHLSYENILQGYIEYNPRNLIVKYTFFNKKGKSNIFIGSSIVNDEECSIRFNGYITVKREF